MSTNAQWQQRKVAAIARGEGNINQFYVEKAKNAEVWDVEGNRYIDLGAGIAVVNTGHSHPKIVEAVKKQIDNFSHTCVMVSPYDSAVQLAERLNELMPGETPKKTVFVTTGAEAVENCVKIARAHTGRRGIIAFHAGYHGRTNMTMALTGKITPYKNLFGPFPAEIFHSPYPNSLHGVSIEDALKGLDMVFKTDLEPRDCAAIIIEPVLGEGGFYQTPPEFLQALRQICDEHGIVLIADEIQTGFARTGKFYCTEYSGIEPDLMTTAKGIAGGFPIAAVVGKAEIMDAPLPGGIGGTYAGSPVACAAALAVLDIIEEEGLVERAEYIGNVFNKRLRNLQHQFPHVIADVRNLGAMIAIELVKDGDIDAPDAELTKQIAAHAPEHGLIVLACGFRGNVIRFLPALTIEEEIMHEALDKFEGLFKSLAPETTSERIPEISPEITPHLEEVTERSSV